MTMFEMRMSDDGRLVCQIDMPVNDGYVMGRTDEASEYVPDIDLTPFGARDKGVSRRHAALVAYRGALHALDLNSVNGTYINGQRLAAEVPHPLKPGDELRLGTLALRIAAVE